MLVLYEFSYCRSKWLSLARWADEIATHHSYIARLMRDYLHCGYCFATDRQWPCEFLHSGCAVELDAKIVEVAQFFHRRFNLEEYLAA